MVPYRAYMAQKTAHEMILQCGVQVAQMHWQKIGRKCNMNKMQGQIVDILQKKMTSKNVGFFTNLAIYKMAQVSY